MKNNRQAIPMDVRRKLWADSLGSCGNPGCEEDLFNGTSIGEIAHIQPYAKGGDNSYNNLIILCANCHTKADKDQAIESLKEWKTIQEKSIERIKSKRFNSFEVLKEKVRPILEKNKLIYERYYLRQPNSDLWKKIECEVLSNNKKLELMLERNMHLFQGTTQHSGSNASIAQEFLLHIKEFEKTRGDKEKHRSVLFPAEINSMFEIEPIQGKELSNVSALQKLIKHLKSEGRFIRLDLTNDPPTITFLENNKHNVLQLTDAPRVKQMYWDKNCYRNSNSKLRLDSLLFFLRWVENSLFNFSFPKDEDLSHIIINNKYKVKMVYEYCLSQADLQALSPPKGLLIVNLHNFNGDDCISEEARIVARDLGCHIFTTNAFYRFVHNGFKYK